MSPFQKSIAFILTHYSVKYRTSENLPFDIDVVASFRRYIIESETDKYVYPTSNFNNEIIRGIKNALL